MILIEFLPDVFVGSTGEDKHYKSTISAGAIRNMGGIG